MVNFPGFALNPELSKGSKNFEQVPKTVVWIMAIWSCVSPEGSLENSVRFWDLGTRHVWCRVSANFLLFALETHLENAVSWSGLSCTILDHSSRPVQPRPGIGLHLLQDRRQNHLLNMVPVMGANIRHISERQCVHYI